MVNWYVYIGLATVFIATFSLLFIFHSLEQFSLQCEANQSSSPLCSQLGGFSLSMLIVLLIIGGFVITITATAYILLSAGQSS
jgi:hypothetical protein